MLVGGLGWWFGILGVPLSNNPFHKGILGMQTTNPNQQFFPLVDQPRTAGCPGIFTCISPFSGVIHGGLVEKTHRFLQDGPPKTQFKMVGYNGIPPINGLI